jgi:SNF2-related domain
VPQTQILQYVDFQYCTDKIPLIFEYCRIDGSMPVNEAIDLCQRRKTHAPVVFIDNSGSRPLPSAEFLSMFQIVITTTHRFMNEAKRGSFQTELDLRDSMEDNPYSGFLTEDEKCSVLLKIHWLRLVVDEGHSMGHDKTNSTIQFAAWVRSHRRWAMTGTPTKHNSAQLGQLRGLLRFLQHDFFSARLGGDVVWKKHIAKCWRDGDISSFFRIRSLLCFLMRRHTKFHIVELPSPTYTKIEIPMSCLEANTYNTLVSAVQMNLLLTSMKGKTSGLQDSLLHRSQAKNARLAIQNVRRVCTGWSRVIPTISNRFHTEALDMARSLNLSENVVAEIGSFMSRAGREELSSCSCCGIRVSTLLLMSCCGGQSKYTCAEDFILF